MMQEDTIRLLRECNTGTQMGYDALHEVCDNVKNPVFKQRLETGMQEHQALQAEVRTVLNANGQTGKDPSPIAKGMSWLKTNAELLVKGSDDTVADLITDGCNMGVKTVSRHLNRCADADTKVKDIAQRLIQSEEKLAVDIRKYL